MAKFEPGNQFWKNRTTHGRDVLFKDPNLVWGEACKYFDNCDENPIETIEFHGKDADECMVPKMRAYTKTGLCVFLDCSINTFEALKDNPDFLTIYTRICQIIYTQKFEGAAAGVLNANIISRDLGLKEQTEVETKNPVSEEKLDKILEKLQ